MMVRVFAAADPPYGLIQGVRTVRPVDPARAVTPWFACGWYEHLIVDLSSFHDWSPETVDLMARAVTAAADAGYWLGFFPASPHLPPPAGDGLIQGYPDLTQAQAAMQRYRPQPAEGAQRPGGPLMPSPAIRLEDASASATVT